MLGPADRCRSGSLAIDSCSGAEAQCVTDRWIQAGLCRSAGACPRWRGSQMERDGTLRARVLSRLAQGWSPEQVAGRLALEAGRVVISHESIYRFIYGQLARTKDYGWRHYLPRAKSKRGWRGRKGGSPASFMALRRPIAERPESVADRRTPGHWEADLDVVQDHMGMRCWPCTSATPAC